MENYNNKQAIGGICVCVYPEHAFQDGLKDSALLLIKLNLIGNKANEMEMK